MVTSFCFLTCALAIGQAPERGAWQIAPQLAPGLELVYSGTYAEENLIPNVQFKRQYKLETTLFVLEGGPRQWDLAFLTSLSLRDRPGPDKEGPAATSVRLELGQMDQRGRARGNSGGALLVPLAGPPTLEAGFLVEGPMVPVKKGESWEVAEAGRPPRIWQVQGIEMRGNLSCLKIVGQQQSEDWDKPRADRTAWRRRDTIWLIPHSGICYRVERLLERRDPARREPTHRLEAIYELDSRLKYPGRLLEDRRQEIMSAKKFQEDAAPLFKQPVLYQAKLEVLDKKVAQHLTNQPPTPYRKALLHLQHQIEQARRGETPVDLGSDEAAVDLPAVAIGQRVPDFVVTSLTAKESMRFNRALGRPSVVFFYNPATETGRKVLQFAKELSAKHGQQVGILAMAVTQDGDLARKQHAEMRLPFPILDGNGMHLTFGVEATPRLVVIDHEGNLRGAYTGWGVQTPGEITEELARWLRNP